MKIRETDKVVTMFADLEEGEVFRYGGTIYMKIEENEEEENVVCLTNGALDSFGYNGEVEALPNAFLTV